MNLAFWRYRNIVGEFKPIEKVISQKLVSGSGLEYYEAYSYLRGDLISGRFLPSALYGNSAGTGSSPSKIFSVFKSISEAIERWAYFYCIDNYPSLAGIHLDSTTNGFSAFPGVFASSARNAAFNEAVERWALVNWWKGQLPLREVQLFSPIRNYTYKSFQILAEGDSKISLLSGSFLDSTGRKLHTYGFAADFKIERAQQRALVELERNMRVLGSLSKRSEVQRLENLQDARLVYFSSEEGNRFFMNRVHSSLTLSRGKELPKLIFDSEVPGEWSKYASVWRCVLEPHFVEDKINEFFF